VNHQSSELVFLMDPLSVPALLVAAAVIAGMVWYGVTLIRGAGRFRGSMLLSLRSLALVLLCVILLQPSLVTVSAIEVQLPDEFFRKEVRIFEKDELDRLLPPLSSVPLPEEKPSLDVALHDVIVPPVAFFKSTCSVRAVVENDGPARQTQIVLARLDGKAREVIRTTAQLKPGRQEVELSLTPDSVGWTAWSVQLSPSPQDSDASNNTFVFALTVVRESLRILHIAGRPSWDVRFLRKLLTSTPGTELVSFYLLVEAEDFAPHSREELSLIPFPTDELFITELGNFDLVIVQNFPLGTYFLLTPKHLSRLVEYVKEGGGILFVGGDEAFSLGAVNETPVAEVVPAEMAPPDAEGGYLEGQFVARLAPDGLVHPVTTFRGQESEAQEPLALGKLPSLTGVNRLGRVAAWGQILVTASSPSTTEELPLVVAGRTGKGRVVAVATDSLWRWAFPAELAQDPPAVYRRLLLNSILWLARDPRMAGMSIEAVDALPVEGKPVQVAACIRGEAQPGEFAHVKAQWVDASGKLPSISTQQDVAMSQTRCGYLTLPPAGPGAWLVEAAFESDGLQLSGSGVVAVRPRTETAAARLARKILPLLDVSYYPLTEDRPFEVTPGPRSLMVDKPEVTTLWDNPVFFAVLLALLSAEWLLRKRWGYL